MAEQKPRVFSRASNDPTRGAGAETMSEFPPAYAPRFPYNNVIAHTESGHMIELDDTPGAERVHVYHRSGSHIELRPDGSVKYKTVNTRQDVTVGDQEVIVQGDWKVTVDGAIKIYARSGSLEVQSDNGAAFNIKGEMKIHADNILLKAKNKISLAAPFVDVGSPTYLSLPTQVAPLFGVLVPVMGGLKMKAGLGVAPTGITSVLTGLKNFKSVGTSSNFSPNSILASLSDGTPQLPEISQPEEIPLSCPALYKGVTKADIHARDRHLDTPDDVGDSETYTAHLSLCNEIGDFNE